MDLTHLIFQASSNENINISNVNAYIFGKIILLQIEFVAVKEFKIGDTIYINLIGVPKVRNSVGIGYNTNTVLSPAWYQNTVNIRILSSNLVKNASSLVTCVSILY